MHAEHGRIMCLIPFPDIHVASLASAPAPSLSRSSLSETKVAMTNYFLLGCPFCEGKLFFPASAPGPVHACPQRAFTKGRQERHCLVLVVLAHKKLGRVQNISAECTPRIYGQRELREP
jgi:hypothetical protein